MSLKSKYPAAYIVHWPSGPVSCCDQHARELRGMANFLGAHVAITAADDSAECMNCVNEAAAVQPQADGETHV